MYKFNALIAALAVSLPAAATLQARDLDGNPATTEAYYDTSLKITWLADWRLADNSTWAQAAAWTAALDVNGVAGWRLPFTNDCTAWSCSGTSELANLWDETLGNTPGTSAGVNTGPFTNMARGAYWTGTTSGTQTYVYSTFNGFQSLAGRGNAYAAVAVRDGDVSLVPELPTAALLLAGCTLLALRPSSHGSLAHADHPLAHFGLQQA
jgi:hypothetical protein